ncbi:MAG: hypothetical protein IT385_00800 [Deltaproteobacteria bacterium]|nr:hypothetical protein [Deltaproteobacteria bacterium]
MNPITLARAFKSGQVYGPLGPVRAVAALMTRRSLLVFTRQTTLKLRIPGVVDGLDQSPLSVRIGLADRERAIGRSLAPHAYLDDCGLLLSSEGELLLVHEVRDAEPIVATWRQPAERQALALVLAGEVGPTGFDQTMDALARHHGQAGEPRPERRWDPRARDHWAAALGRLADAPTEVITDAERRALADSTDAWLRAMDKVLVHRATERRVRDLHGELSLEHVFLVDPPVVIDPADVASADERFADTAEDVMRLAMELDLAGAPELAEAAVARYALSALDARLADVAPFFKRLSAVRVAVDALAEPAPLDGEPDDRHERARAALALALVYPM